MAGLFIEFWLRNASLVKVGNPIFRFLPCWMRVEKSQAILALLDSSLAASRMASLSNYCICVCLFVFFISNFMKSRAVYEASLYSFVLRLETMICPSTRFDIRLQNFKKPAFSRYFLTVNRKEKRSEEY